MARTKTSKRNEFSLAFPPARKIRPNLAVLEAAMAAFNSKHHAGDVLKVFERYHPKRNGNSRSATVKLGAYILNEYVFVDFAELGAVYIGCVEWRP